MQKIKKHELQPGDYFQISGQWYLFFLCDENTGTQIIYHGFSTHWPDSHKIYVIAGSKTYNDEVIVVTEATAREMSDAFHSHHDFEYRTGLI